MNTVIKTIKDAVKSFKSLVSTFKNTDFSDIIKHLIESVKQLPRNVLNLRRIGKRIYKAIGKFVELPPVVTQVKNLVTKVTTLFNDIKTDVMTLYNVSMCPLPFFVCSFEIIFATKTIRQLQNVCACARACVRACVRVCI